MLTLGPIGFLSPWILLGLGVLPVIYWLLRITPPSPKLVRFPALQLLFGLTEAEQTPARTPLWLLLMRLFLAALIILALAGPVLNPQTVVAGQGPLVVAVDDGWAAGERWTLRRDALRTLIADAGRAERSVVLLSTSRKIAPEPLSLLSASEADRLAEALEPKPYAADREAALAALDTVKFDSAPEIVWLADGIEDGKAKQFAEGLAAKGSLRVLTDKAGSAPLAVTPPQVDPKGLRFRVLRSESGFPFNGTLRAIGQDGRYIGQAPFSFDEKTRETATIFELPSDLQNEITRVDIDGRASAGAVVLIDERFRRRPVGLVSGANADLAQPLLSDLHYLTRALEPYAEVRAGTVHELIANGLAVLVLADIGQIVGSDKEVVAKWINEGGLLVRFAGPKLAAQADDLIPVQLRSGGRALGGALSWAEPQGLGAFADDSPFSGLKITPDIRVKRQVLAEPSVDLGEKTWARLTDGTPLVTAEKRGKGTIVLFHVTANADWSNLPMSGLFVEMLRRMIAAAHGLSMPPTDGETATSAVFPPRQTLDGFGRLGAPPPTATPIKSTDLATLQPNPKNPPGFYGTEGASIALNLMTAEAKLDPLPPLPETVARGIYGENTTVALADPFLTFALLLFLADLMITLVLRGFLQLPARRVAKAAAAIAATAMAFAAFAPQAKAQDDSETFALAASTQTRLAYVTTGDESVDEMSRLGLAGLTTVLNQRTAVEAAEPIAVDIEKQELAFFPLLYWPIASSQKDLSPQALSKVDAYMKNGGTILFDTRDQDSIGAGSNTGPGSTTLRRLLGNLDIPPLAPVGEGHIITKAFYLLTEFPGRYSGGQIWVEASHDGETGEEDPNGATASSSDGVSSIIIGGNDWAAAWARDDAGRPIAALQPGGDRQSEMAMRFGVNIVMYTLTGNYKSDQVHVPALLERLGQ